MSATTSQGGTAVARFGSSKAVRRLEDPALVRGQGRYTDDLAPAGQAHLVFLRSPHAHARIRGIDASAARALPGVLAVHTGDDLVAAGVRPMPMESPFGRPDGQPAATPPRHALAVGAARFAGEAVCAVVAETREAARAAADAIDVDYEVLPAVVDCFAAMAPGAPALCPQAPDNIAAEVRHGDPAAVAAAFAKAAHRVCLDIDNQRCCPVTMEPRTMLADPTEEPGRLVVHISNQMPTAVRDGLASLVPGLSTATVRVRVGDVGGGFGMKTGPYPEDLAIAWAALQLGRPVKWRADRVEEFTASTAGRDAVSRAEMALDADGRVLALRVRTLNNVGAYATSTNIVVPLLVGPWVTTSIYDIQAIDLRLTAVLTNTATQGPYRGAGRPEAIYLIERLFDAAARQTGIDGVALRRRNLIGPAQFPYANPMAQTYDSGAFERILDQGLALADWEGFEARREASAARGWLRGRGIAAFLEWTSGGALDERIVVDVKPEGVIELRTALQGMGQGIATSLAQLAVDTFQVPIDRIRVISGDTDGVNGFGSAGSRSLYIGGSAVQVASNKALDAGRDLAAQALEASAGDIEYREGRYTVAGTDVAIGLFELAGRQAQAGIRGDATLAATGPSWPNGCHVCEVEVDPGTGEVRIVGYASVNDIGYVVSPVLAKGQIEGGVVQGVGQALCERMAYDPATGQALSASFMDYAIPRADGFVGLQTRFDTSVPSLTNPLGAKGVGELGTIGATPAVMNAIVDALDRAGLGAAAVDLQMPATAERVWRALHRRDFGPPVWQGTPLDATFDALGLSAGPAGPVGAVAA
ncbi:MAG: xanthine dehydrogenase family protein molybdopterin-binding subunit [Rubrivivax sp.]